MTYRARTFLTVLVVVLVALAAGASTGWVLGRAVAAPVTPDQFRQQLARERDQADALRARLAAARRDRDRWRGAAMAPDGGVRRAFALASATYGVPVARLSAVAYCESTHNPQARNGQYVGLFQFGPRTWGATPYRALPPTDPAAAALATAWLAQRDGWGHWPECGRLA